MRLPKWFHLFIDDFGSSLKGVMDNERMTQKRQQEFANVCNMLCYLSRIESSSSQ